MEKPITENELILADRLGVIRDTVGKWGEENFYLSFSGGKDSTVISSLLDEALPGNEIPRVFINTGIEYAAIVSFVHSLMEKDSRFVEIKPSKPIIQTLKTHGYPFKSKEHSLKIGEWQKGCRSPNIVKYSRIGKHFACPKSLSYQFSSDFKIRLSNTCCYYLKKKPAYVYSKMSGRNIPILGLRMAEGGQRSNHKGCAVFDKKGSLKKFKPLNPITEKWEQWFIQKQSLKLCDLYYPPFNFKRTGCKGCPFAIDLESQLEKMSRLMPLEEKQCELIWEPIYREYRRIGYRLKKNSQTRLF